MRSQQRGCSAEARRPHALTSVSRLTARLRCSSLLVRGGAASSVSPSAVSAALCDSALFHLRCAWRARVAVGDSSELATAHCEAAQRCLRVASKLDGSNGSVQCLLWLRAAECGRVDEAQRWVDSLAALKRTEAEQSNGALARLLVSRSQQPPFAVAPACCCCCCSPCAASADTARCFAVCFWPVRAVGTAL